MYLIQSRLPYEMCIKFSLLLLLMKLTYLQSHVSPNPKKLSKRKKNNKNMIMVLFLIMMLMLRAFGTF